MTYKHWISKVDQVMISVFGLAFDDLPDALWRDKFDDDMSTVDAIESTVEDELICEMADVWLAETVSTKLVT